jgi:prolyl oligopeptidase
MLPLSPTRGADNAQPGAPGAVARSNSGNDPYLWLEDVTAERSLDWVRAQNAISTKELESSPDFEPIRSRLLAILDSKERIPGVAKHGRYYYNFWRDQTNVRGLWRRTTLDEYKKAAPAWETVLDLDQLATAEKENWVWKGYDILYPTYDRCLIMLSRGGAHATVVREFDVTTKEFESGSEPLILTEYGSQCGLTCNQERGSLDTRMASCGSSENKWF